MGRRIFSVVLLLVGIGILLFVVLPGCQNTASPGEEVTLRIGQSVAIKGEDLKITFAGVSGDSRCPADAVCVWAGEVTCLMEIKQDGGISFVDFVYPGLTGDYNQLLYNGHTYNFKVQPYPYSDKPIADSEYRLFLMVD